MAGRPTIVIVGAGLAGARAAETLRRCGYDGRLVLVGEEPVRPYERPQLSKAYLAGRLPPGRVHLRPAEWYRAHRIELQTGHRVTELDPSAGRVRIDGGRPLAFDRCLLATGSRPRRLAVPGSDLDGVHPVRTLADADRLRKALSAGPRVAVVGAGLLGCEVAAVARQAGCDVVLLEVGAVPAAHDLGAAAGAFVERLHRAHGVEVRARETVTSIHGEGRVEAVVTSSGRVLDADLVVAAVGAEPRCELALAAGLTVTDGIEVDERGRTAAERVYAAGDAARWWRPQLGRRVRVEHADSAQGQAEAAARAMLGLGGPGAPIPYVWTEQYDVTIQRVGDLAGTTTTVVRGDPGSGSFSVVALAGARVRACVAVGRLRDLTAARRLIAADHPVDPGRLTDPDADLAALLPRGRTPPGQPQTEASAVKNPG